MDTIVAKSLRSFFTALLGLMLMSYALGGQAAEPGRRSDFDHLRTGFPLTGAHAIAACESCHVSGVFRGTPTQCEVCHTRGSRIPATAKPANHVPTIEPCDQCHRSAITWSGARFSHVTVSPGACGTCHGITASGKPARHVVTTASCDTCHRTLAWIPARFNHADVAPGSCTTCHGVTATGKPARHVMTTASCDTCHRTTAWLPAGFNHAGVAPGSCTTCHCVTATCKPVKHPVTTDSCDVCHRTTAWLPATFNHAGVAPGSCNGCHNKPTGHFVTTLACDSCHTTTLWTSPRYTHSSPYYRQHSSGVTCRNCHTGNTDAATWTYATYKPDCAGCHAGKYKSDPHKKTEVPTTIRYTVAELKDCAGSCHIYTDNTFTVIKTTRSGKHRSTSGGF
jgi:hypothetical protein